eukprot:GFKZ01005010.1.p1 GENE.GFKZ01005010.1~~GFKZ01005010.1.p1  ORF type:complete len:275 (+),score=29.35 GFKZ01005010.1:187-1011(+)
MIRRPGTLRALSSRTQAKRLTSLAAAHSSWFKLENQGMEHFELLARGSGFYIRGPQTGIPIALVSAHVAAPHRFRNYFPHDWLSYVRDADCRSVLEARSADGKSVKRCIATQTLSHGFRHASLDVAAFVLDDDDILKQDAEIKILTLTEAALEKGTEVSIAGFRLLGESGSGTEAVVATEVPGSVSELSPTRGFIDTGSTETEMGMCGGPVVLKQDKDSCAGILEGLVPRRQPGDRESDLHERVGGHSVFLGAKELGMFVHDVETEYARGVASG